MATRPTTLGALLMATAWVAFVTAFVLGTLAPALLGLVLLGAVESARRTTSKPKIDVTRRLPARAWVDQPFTIETQASADPPVPLWVETDVPASVRIDEDEHTHGRGSATHRVRARAYGAGTIPWAHVHVRVAEPWGLWESHETRRLPAQLNVQPPAGGHGAGRGVSRRLRRAQGPGQRGADPVPDVALVRDYAPGDLSRDIDWPRSARLERLITRVRERVGPRPVIVLVDATASMRRHRRHAKLNTAAQIAQALAGAAVQARVGFQLVAFHESGVVHTTGAEGGRAVREAADRLAQLPAPAPGPPGSPVHAMDRPLAPAERRFLRHVARFVGGPIPSAPPLQAALALVSRRAQRGTLVVAILDGEVWPQKAIVTARRLKQRGLDVAIVVPATGTHHYRRRDVDPAIEREIVAAYDARERLRRDITATGARFIVAHPETSKAVLQEVVAWT